MYFEINSPVWFPNWAGSTIGGDSSSPVFVLIQNELVLLGAWYGSSPVSPPTPPPADGDIAPWCGYDIKTLNTTISNLCVSAGSAVYQVTTKDLSAFPDL